MELKFTISTTVKQVKEQFTRSFPFLKLEFFMRHREENTEREERLNDELYLWEVTGVLKEGVYYLNPSVSVDEFEQDLQFKYGLPVQVYRRTGDVWIETVQADDLSLEKHNSIGEAATNRLAAS